MEASLEARLDQLVRRHAELSAALAGSGLSGAEFAKLSKEYSELSPIVEGIDSLKRARDEASSIANIAETSEDLELQQLAEEELRIDVFRASGPGGQSVNTTDSAVRITHLPTGLVVIQQDEKSQHKNKAKALKVLRSRLYDMERQARDSARAAERKSQVGTGDRSERIRTYNFPQGRVTDHRINLTLYKIDKVMSGEALDEITDALLAEDQAARLAAVEGPGG